MMIHFHSLDRILALHPDLDADLISAIVRQSVAPAARRDANNPSFGEDHDLPAIAALPVTLMVRHTPAGHAVIEKYLTYIESQADAFPHPCDLARDDSAVAIAELICRLAAADDPQEVAWLAALATLVEQPTEELTVAVVHAMIAARERRDAPLYETLELSAMHCGIDSPGVTAFLVAELGRELDDEVRETILLMLSKMGADGRIALTRRLGAIADRRGGDVSSAAASREATRIIELLGAKVPTEPDLIPALVPLLRGKHKIWAALALDKIDWSGRNGIAHLETRLADPDLLDEERAWLQELADKLRDEISHLYDPFGPPNYWTRCVVPRAARETPPPAATNRDPFAP